MGFPRLGLLLPPPPPPADWLGFGPAPMAAGTFFLISGARSARSLRSVSSRAWSLSPSAFDTEPPAAPTPSRPSTNFTGSNCI